MTMNPALSAFNHVVAFEVAKDSLVIHVLPTDKQSIAANKPKAIRKALMAEMRSNAEATLGPLLVVCEATGGYERHVLAICLELGVAAHKAHGSRVRHFARYLGLLAKTDPIDARVLALYGLKTTDLRLYVPPAPEVLALRDLKTRRDQLQQMLFAENSRLEHARHASVSRSLKAHIASLRKALAALEAEIAAHASKLARHSRVRRASCERSKASAPRPSRRSWPTCPNSATLKKAEAACIAGLAPINKDSGERQAPRHIEAGRAAVRKALYMAALVAIQHNPVMRLFADKLRRNGKPSKVVITAVMRKLIVTLNAILRSGEP